jgi:hypothetical protein
MSRITVKVFHYVDALDCFVLDELYAQIAGKLGFAGRPAGEWIGRYLAPGNLSDGNLFGSPSAALQEKAGQLGLANDELFVIDAGEFDRKKFLADVLRSLELSLEMIYSEAVKANSNRDPDDKCFVADLEPRFAELKSIF